MPLKSTPQTYFRSVGVTRAFHIAIRELAAKEEKKMYEILEALCLPVLQKRLAKLNAKAMRDSK